MRSHPLAMFTMHTPPAPPAPDRIPSKESILSSEWTPPSWDIHYHQSKENASRNEYYTMQFIITLIFGSPGPH